MKRKRSVAEKLGRIGAQMQRATVERSAIPPTLARLEQATMRVYHAKMRWYGHDLDWAMEGSGTIVRLFMRACAAHAAWLKKGKR